MFRLKLVTTIAFTLLICIFVYSELPRFLSFADPIDPEHLTDSYDLTQKIAIFNDRSINIPPDEFTQNISPVLGDSSVPKRIEVDLTNQRLYGFEGNQLVYNFLISSGMWDRTPTGTFKIWAKIRSQKMSGGSKELGTYYYLPNVPYILFFYNDKIPKTLGYSLHGTYWHNNFGTPMSHGCVNMRTPEVEQIFSWADETTPITIYGHYIPKITISDTPSKS